VPIVAMTAATPKPLDYWTANGFSGLFDKAAGVDSANLT
jgi:hypothetical protein